MARLGEAKVVICWVSPAYLRRRACVEELTLALMAEERELSTMARPNSRRVLAILDGEDISMLPDRLIDLRLPSATDGYADRWAAA